MSLITTDPATRQDFITGLRELADFLAANPAVCVPHPVTEITLTAGSPDDGGCAQVDRFARQLGIQACDDLASTGLYWSGRFFGAIGFVMTVTPGNQPDTWT